LENGANLLERAMRICDEHLHGPSGMSDQESCSILDGELTGPQGVFRLLGGDGIPAKLYAVLLARSIPLNSSIWDELFGALHIMEGGWPRTFDKQLQYFHCHFETLKFIQTQHSHFGRVVDYRTWGGLIKQNKGDLEIDFSFLSMDPLFRIPMGVLKCSVRLIEAWHMKELTLPISASSQALSCLEIVETSVMPLEMLQDVFKYRFLLSKRVFRDPLYPRQFFTFREGLLESVHLALLSLKKDYCQKGWFD
jgi:hypothetical protein